MIHWYHLLWIVPLTAVVASQITSWQERKNKYNLNDLEKDTLHNLWLRLQGIEKTVLGKIKEAL